MYSYRGGGALVHKLVLRLTADLPALVPQTVSEKFLQESVEEQKRFLRLLVQRYALHY